MTPAPCSSAVAARFPVERFDLANGLQVVVQTDVATPLVASLMCYPGARHDPPGRSGLAHLSEHLAYDGALTGKTPYPARIERVGGSPSATTMSDRLCFAALVPRSELGALLEVEAERLEQPLAGADNLEAQRRVVLEELRERSQHRVRAVAFEQLHRQLFPEAHPYHRPPAGAPEEIHGITLADVQTSAAMRFTPRAALLVLVGDVTAAQARERVEAAFGALPAGHEAPPPALGSAPAPAPEGERVRQIAALPAPRAHVAWSVPGYGHDDYYAASLLMRGLSAGRSSPLARALVERAGVAQDVHGHLVGMRDASTLVFAANAARGVDEQRLEQALEQALDELLARPAGGVDLARAQRKALSDHFFLAQSLDRRADMCASLSCFVGQPERLESEPQRYLDVDAPSLGAFAAGLRQATSRARLTLVPAAERA